MTILAATSPEPIRVLACSVPDEPLYEVVNGQRMELPPMSVYASWIASELISLLRPYAKAQHLGTVVMETLFILDAARDLRRRPDVAFVSAATWPLSQPLPETGDWAIVPDLAVEVLSPNDLFKDVFAKMREYFQLGVRQVWLVLPTERQVHVYDSPTKVRIVSAGEELDGGTLLSGLRLPVAALFNPETAPR